MLAKREDGYIAPVETKDDDSSSVPQLTADQAMYISLLMESASGANAATEYRAIFEREPELDTWFNDPAFNQALSLADSNRPLLFRAMSHALFGKAFRTLYKMMDVPRTSGKAVELLLRIHGMLIDRVKDERPDEYRDLINLLRERAVPANTDFHIKGREPRAPS